MDPAKWFPNTPSMRGDTPPESVPVSDQTDRPLSVAERFYGRDTTPEEVAAAAQASPGGPPAEFKPFNVPEEFGHLGIMHDQESFDAFVPIARELGLSQDAAQRLVNFHLSRVYGAGK